MNSQNSRLDTPAPPARHGVIAAAPTPRSNGRGRSSGMVRPEARTDTARSPADRRDGPGDVLGRLLSVPLFYKILLANGAIIALLAVTIAVAVAPVVSRGLALLLGAGALALTIVINAVILRLALRPLAQLQETAESLRRGADVRVEPTALADRNMTRLMRTFNHMLDANAEHRSRLRAIAVTALGAAEEERRRIARELYDGTAQELAALRVGLKVARQTRDAGERERLLQSVSEEVGRLVEDIRELAGGLSPPALEMLGLGATIENFARQLDETSDIRVRTRIAAIAGLLEPEAELAMYRIVQEAVTNVAKHACARHIDITLEPRAGHVAASVTDDGCGFVLADEVDASALGLFGMQERAGYVGGYVEIDTGPGAGTTVTVMIPMKTGTHDE